MNVSNGPRDGGMQRLFVPWLYLSAAIGFELWVMFSGAAELRQLPVGLGRYFFFFPLGSAAAGILCAMLWLSGTAGAAERLGYVSCLFYLGFLKTPGWNFIPWVLLVAAAVGFLRTGKSSKQPGSSLLLLHAMGTMTGLYMSFHLHEFLQPRKLFMETVRSLLGLLFS